MLCNIIWRDGTFKNIPSHQIQTISFKYCEYWSKSSISVSGNWWSRTAVIWIDQLRVLSAGLCAVSYLHISKWVHICTPPSCISLPLIHCDWLVYKASASTSYTTLCRSSWHVTLLFLVLIRAEPISPTQEQKVRYDFLCPDVMPCTLQN